MTATTPPEYRQLERESSNDLIRHDARRGDGKYPEAAWHALQAGLARYRMGQIMSESGEYVFATEDWLSAAACFYLATDPNRMKAAFGRAEQLVQEGKIPPERRDIYEALKEREKEIGLLVNKLSHVWQDYSCLHSVGPARTAGQESLRWLLAKVRELPGSPRLYAKISVQAREAGQQAAAVEALAWAQRFDPTSQHLAALRVSQLFDYGEPVKAAQAARELLTIHPEMDSVRFLLAQALAFRAGPHSTNWVAADWEAALEVLQPMIESEPVHTLEKLLAVALAVVLHYSTGSEVEYARLLDKFDRVAKTINSPLATELVVRSREALPQIFLRHDGNGVHSLAKPDYSVVRDLFEPLQSMTVSAIA